MARNVDKVLSDFRKKYLNTTPQSAPTPTNPTTAVFTPDHIKKIKANARLKNNLGDLQNIGKEYETAHNAYYDKEWKDPVKSLGFITAQTKYYQGLTDYEKNLKANEKDYKLVYGEKAYNEMLKAVQDEIKGKSKAQEGLKNTATLFSKFKNEEEFKKFRSENKYNYIDTFDEYNKYLKRYNNDLSHLPETERTFLLQKGYILEYKESKYAIDALTKEKQRIEAMLAPNSKHNLSHAEKAEKEKDLEEVKTKINTYSARLKEMDKMGDIYTGLNTLALSENSEYAFEQKYSGAKKAMEEYLAPTEKDKLRKMSGLPVPEKEIKDANDAITNGEAGYAGQMTEDEKMLYSFIKQQGGEKAARMYFDDLVVAKLDKKYNAKLLEDFQKFATDKNGIFGKLFKVLSVGGVGGLVIDKLFPEVGSTMGKIGQGIGTSALSVPMNLLSGIEHVGMRAAGIDGIRSELATGAQGIRSGVSSQINSDVFKFIYNVGMSGLDSAAGAAASAFLGPLAGEILLGGSAAASAYNEALDRGISHDKAMLTSVAAGLAESIFEHISIGKILDGGDIVKGFTKQSVGKMVKKMFADMGVNASEELFTEATNIIVDMAVNGQLSSYAVAVKNYYEQGMSEEEARAQATKDLGTQLLEAAGSGALMGFGFGATGSFSSAANSQARNTQSGELIKHQGSVQQLKSLAANSGVADIQKAAEDLTDSSKPSKIGYVYNSLVDNAVDNAVKQMTPVLLENGATKSGSNSAEGWAKQIATSVLNPNADNRFLFVNKVTKDVYTDFVKNGKYGGNKLVALRDMADLDNRSNKFGTGYVTQSGNIINEQGVEVPMTAEGRMASGPVAEGSINTMAPKNVGSYDQNGEMLPATSGSLKGIASAPKSGQRTIAEAYGQRVAEKLEAERPNKKAIKEQLKKYMPNQSRITAEGEKIVKDWAKTHGLKVEFTDDLVDEIANGRYDKDTNTLYISRYSINPIKIVIKHEFTHSTEVSKFYNKFKDYAFKESKAFKSWLEKQGVENFEQAVQKEYNKIEAAGLLDKYENPTEIAENEVIANFVSETLFNKDGTDLNEKTTADFLKELAQKDRNLFERFVDYVKNLLKRMFTTNGEKRDLNRLEQKFLRLVEDARSQRGSSNQVERSVATKNKTKPTKVTKVAEETKTKPQKKSNKVDESYEPQFADVMKEMGMTDGEQGETEETETKQEAINEQTNKVGVEYDSETESVSQYSLASWENSDYVKDRNVAAQQIADAIGVSKKTAIKYINSINGIAKAIAEDKERLDYVAAVGRSAFVSNTEYGGSIDTSTLCQKRRWLTGTFSAIQKELKNSALTASEVLKIRNMLKDKGIEVSCGLCYVEGSRAEMGVFAKQFIERYKKTNPKYVPNMAEINTPEGIEEIRMKHPEVYEAYERFWNNKGVLNEGDSVLFASQRKPKLYSVRTDYKHEILDKFKNEDNVSAKNDNGGLRIQSFSDFEVVHLIDMMQVIMDMSRVGLAGQAYTKVPEFALALGNTGLKINLSLIAKDVDANGNLVFDNVEGMNVDTAMRIRDMYSKNVGTILVVFNDAQFKTALNDSRVDFIIPFHRSQWKRSQYAEIGLPANTKDYTYMQNERYIKPVYYTTRKGTQGKKKATNYMPSEYWDYNKSGKENAKAYLEKCAKENKRPKFYKLLVDNKDGSYSLQPDGSTDGYWKLLIDFKMYDNNGKGSPQTPVKPIFNMEESMKMLNEYKGEHKSFPVDQEVVDAFVSEYKQKHKLDEFTESKTQKSEVKDKYDLGQYSLPDIEASDNIDYLMSSLESKKEKAVDEHMRKVDERYNEAIKSGDVATQEKLVAEAAKREGAILDDNGEPLKLYRGTKGGQTVFSKKDTLNGKIYTIDNIIIASNYGDKTGKATEFSNQTEGEPTTYALYGFPKKMLTMDAQYGVWSDLLIPEELQKYSPDRLKATNAQIAEWAEQEGYDALRINNVRDGGIFAAGDEIIFFNENLVKSADPVTYDNNGNIIPPSARFNEQKTDIRYSLPDIPDIAKGKSNTELEQLIKEGKITLDDAFNSMNDQYGTMPKGENPKVDVDVPNKVSDDKGVRRFAKNVLESGHLTDTMSEDAKKEILNGALNYEISSNKKLVAYAENKVRKDIRGAIQEWEALVKSGRMPTAEEIALGEVLLVEAAKADNANDVSMYTAELAAMGTQLGQSVQAFRLLKRLNGAGQLVYVSRIVAQLNNELKQRFGPNKYEIEVNPEYADILAKSKSKKEIDHVVDRLIEDISQQMPSTWVDKLRAWRYLAMLGNLRTHLRNFAGNGVFLPAIRMKDTLAAVAEKAFISNKENRTKSFLVKKEYKNFAEEDVLAVEELLKSGGKMSPMDKIQENRRIFKSGILEGIRKANFGALEWEDWFFLKRHYKHALGSVLQARGLDLNNITEAQLDSARKYAILEAQKATYRDASDFANMLNQASNRRYSNKGNWSLGRSLLNVSVEAAMPFKKTPINVLKRGAEYSPLGIFKGLFEGVVRYAKGEFSGAEFWDSISAGMTGTMLLGLGIWLRSLGVLTGGLGYDDEDALERMNGAQPYAIKIGDFTYTIDWLAPVSLPMFIGAEIESAFKENESINVFDILLTIGEPLSELSFLQGINDMISGASYSEKDSLGWFGEITTNLASSYISQYFPTLTGQVARTADDTRRINFVDKNSSLPRSIQKTIGKIQGKIPGLENEKVPYIDAWGRVEKNNNALLRAFENLASPGYLSKLEDDKVNNELARIFSKTGDRGVIPKKAQNNVTDDSGKTVYLDAKKYVRYAKDKGQYSREYVEDVMSNSMFREMSAESKAEVIKFLFSYADAKAKSNVVDFDYANKANFKTAAKLEAAGFSVSSVALAKVAMMKKFADADGNDSASKSEKRKSLKNVGFSQSEVSKIMRTIY